MTTISHRASPPTAHRASPGSAKGFTRVELLLLTLGALGLLARVGLTALSIGCNDVLVWHEHADIVLRHGVRYAYEHRASYNHPPLMGYWSAIALAVAGADLQRFSMMIKLPGLIGELGSSLIVYRVWRRRDRRAAAKAFALYGWSLTAILVSGYHGNSDAAYAALSLLAVFMMEDRKRPFAAGASLALALNVKLMPVFLIVPLLVRCRSWRDAVRFLGGLSLGVVPYLPYLATSHRQMYQNMIAYNSLQDEWGLIAFLNYAGAGRFGDLAMKLRAWYVPVGRMVIAGSVVVVSLMSLSRRRWTGYDLGALTWALFLVFTPGFGVQYAVSVVPLLFAASLETAVVYSASTGAFLFVMYTAAMAPSFPLEAPISAPYAPLAVLFGVLGWASLVRFVFTKVEEPASGVLPHASASH